MNTEDFDKIIEDRIDKIRKVLSVKAKEYVESGDRLGNFKRAGELIDETPIKALLGFCAKHIVALYDFANRNTNEVSYGQWEEKLGDIINYMILLDGLLNEEIQYDLKVKEVTE